MMPADFILYGLGFLFATIVGWFIHRIRAERAAWRFHNHVTEAMLLAHHRHPASRSRRYCPRCANYYHGPFREHIHQEA